MPKSTPTKTAKASRNKAPVHEAHGALPAKPEMNINQMFGIRAKYADTLADYTKFLNGLQPSALTAHAYEVGIVPVDPRDKLIASLENKYQRERLNQRPHRQIRIPTNPATADFMKQWAAGKL